MCAWPGATAVDDKGSAANGAAITSREKTAVARSQEWAKGVWRWAGTQGSRPCPQVRDEVASLPGMSAQRLQRLQRLQGYFASHSRVGRDLLVSWLSAKCRTR